MDHKQATLAFLKTQVIAVLASINAAGKPQAATIYFAIDDDFTFYFVTKVSTRKYKNLQNNHNVALVVGTEDIPVTVQVEGAAQEIEEVDKKALALDKVSRNSLQGTYEPPLNKLPAVELAIYKLTPTLIRFLDQTSPEVEGHQPIQILP